MRQLEEPSGKSTCHFTISLDLDAPVLEEAARSEQPGTVRKKHKQRGIAGYRTAVVQKVLVFVVFLAL